MTSSIGEKLEEIILKIYRSETMYEEEATKREVDQILDLFESEVESILVDEPLDYTGTARNAPQLMANLTEFNEALVRNNLRAEQRAKLREVLKK